MRSFPAYFRTFHPRKSNPSVMCVMWVFSGESLTRPGRRRAEWRAPPRAAGRTGRPRPGARAPRLASRATVNGLSPVTSGRHRPAPRAHLLPELHMASGDGDPGQLPRSVRSPAGSGLRAGPRRWPPVTRPAAMAATSCGIDLECRALRARERARHHRRARASSPRPEAGRTPRSGARRRGGVPWRRDRRARRRSPVPASTTPAPGRTWTPHPAGPTITSGHGSGSVGPRPSRTPRPGAGGSCGARWSRR